MKTLLKDRARAFRKSMTESEQRLWFFLRNRRLQGYKFVREMVIGPYIADFVCREKRLIVELDGGQHSEALQYDAERTLFLEKEGYRVLRIWADAVFLEVDLVLEEVLLGLGVPCGERERN